MRGDDRAVSEVLGFVLVFGIIIGSVGLMAFVGFEAMTEYQEGEQLRNAERGMVALADNFNDVLRSDGIDERAGELALREGTITTGSGGAVLNVTVETSDGAKVYPLESGNVSLGTFQYSAGGREDTIAYEGGGVFRGDPSGSVTISEPPIRCDTDSGAVIVSLVAIEADDQSLASSNVQEFTAVKERDESQTVVTDVEEVRLEFVEPSPYQNGWERSLTNDGWSDDGAVFTCNGDDVDRVSVHVVVIDIEY